MADGSVVKTEGQVHITLKCGGYKDVIAARVFPEMNKPLILGIPWLSKANPHVDWAQPAVVVKQNHQWISLPLAKSTRRQTTDHLSNAISAKQVSRMLRHQEQMKGAFLGFIRHLGDKERALEMEREEASTNKPKCDPALPDCIRTVLEEYDDVFP